MKLTIKQPKNVKSKQMKLVWKGTFADKRSKQVFLAQKVIDSEVIRLSAPMVPFDQGILSKSAILHTVLGSGKVVYKTPYAAKMYYNPQYNFQGAPLRGAFWFERMKSSQGAYIKKLAGREFY